MVVNDLVPLLLLLVVLAPRPALGGRAEHGVGGHGRVAGEAAPPRSHQGALVRRLHCHNQVAGVGYHHISHLVDGGFQNYLRGSCQLWTHEKHHEKMMMFWGSLCDLKNEDKHLVKTFSSHLDPIHLQHLIIDCQQPC